MQRIKWGTDIIHSYDKPKQHLFHFQLVCMRMMHSRKTCRPVSPQPRYVGPCATSIWGFKTSSVLLYLSLIPIPVYREVIVTTVVVITIAHITTVCGSSFLCTSVSNFFENGAHHTLFMPT
ncbi:hypothetical protein IF2G_01718 [Cordyceps javanica]|nr:hypothetical protein IF2G_01718 [Cordyceps javanica]